MDCAFAAVHLMGAQTIYYHTQQTINLLIDSRYITGHLCAFRTYVRSISTTINVLTYTTYLTGHLCLGEQEYLFIYLLAGAFH